MLTATHIFRTGSMAASYMLGSGVVALAVVVMATSMNVSEIAEWIQQVYGITFLLLTSGLLFIVVYCWIKILPVPTRHGENRFWLEAGMQAANGVTTLALTYTLLGISLGIGSLAGQQLTPETVQGIIRELTGNFSMAFMTTVVGLPLSAILRSLLLVTNARNQQILDAGPALGRGETS